MAVSILARRLRLSGPSGLPVATAVLAAMLLVGALLLLYAGRHLTFFYDEWTFAFLRRGGSVGTFLDPHNGHLVLFSVVVYKLLFTLVGLRHYLPYQAVTVLLHLGCCTALYVIVRRRLGRWLALVPAALLLFMGSAFEDLLWPFQMAYLASVAGGLGALALIERAHPRRDALGSALLILSALSSGVGLAFLVACGVLLVMRGEPLRRLWIVVPPVIVFGAWYLGWGTGEPITSAAILGAPQYDADAAAGAAAGIAGLTQNWGPPLALALVLALGWSRRRREFSPMLLAATAGALVFWTLAALTRAGAPDPTASRYLYVGAAFLWVVGADAAAGVRLGRLGAVLTGLVVAGAMVANVGLLRAGERQLRASDARVRADLAVLDIAAPVVSPAFTPDQLDAPQITAGQYLAARHALGSPALTVDQLRAAPERIRSSADLLLEHAEGLAPEHHPSPPTGTCRQVRPGGELQLASGRTLSFRAERGALVSLRRFASAFGEPFSSAPSATWSTIRFPADAAPEIPWRVRLITSGPIRTCFS